MSKKITYLLIFSVLVLAVNFTAFFYFSQIEAINNNLAAELNNQKKLRRPESKQEIISLQDYSKFRDELVSAKSDFLEVNLDDMKIYFYASGTREREFPVLAKGDPQEWGGSASGLYKVISGNTVSYSLAAEVYMPYALHYYGKYYIHGEPFYPGGGKRYADATGGCIQLSDTNAKTVYNLVKIGLPVLVIDKENDNYQYSTKKTNKFPQISAESYLVADLDSGFVFAEKNSDFVKPIASITKLMTAIVLAENVDLRNAIQINSAMLNAYGSTSGIQTGKILGVVELFYPLLVESSNDAAQALSYFLGQQKTLNLMNEKAKAISMDSTFFASVDGYSADNVSNARDLFYLARYIYNNRPLLLNITKNEPVRAFREISFTDLKNKNLFFADPDFIGGKTGYIIASKYTGMFIFRFNTAEGLERKIAIILLGSPNLENGSGSLKIDTEEIVDWLKINYFQ
jgi:hypothetical protein